MFTSENNSRFVNDNAICEDENEVCQKRISRHSVSSIRQIDTPSEGGGSQAVENVSSPDESTEEKARRRRTRRFSRRRSTSCSTVSLSSSCSKSAKRKRKKKHKHHHRHRSNRANDSYQQPSSPTPTPKVNPIFVWIKQDDTKIVQVLCEDYDRRNRIRLTKTSNGWRSIPLTETLEKRWPFAVAENVQKNELVKTDIPVVIKPDNPLENKELTDNYNVNPSTPAQCTPDVECRISSTSLDSNHFSPMTFQKSPISEETTKVPFVDNTDPFDSDESTQDDLRSIINKVQTDSLYSDDEQCESLTNYGVEFCPVNSTCEDENDPNKEKEISSTIQCDEVSGNEVQLAEPDTNFESHNADEIERAVINQSEDKENDENLANISSNVELEKCTPDKTNSSSSIDENSLRSVTSQNENIEFAAHELSLRSEILQFNNKQKVYHDRTTLYENDAEYFDLGDNNVESSVISANIKPHEPDNASRSPVTVENSNCESHEQSVSQSKTDYVLEKQNALKSEPIRCENEVTESYENVTLEQPSDEVNSSSKCEFPSHTIESPISNIKTEKVDTHEVIDDHVDEYDVRVRKSPEHQEKETKKATNAVVLRSPLCQTLKTTKTCRKVSKKCRNLDELKTEPLPAHLQAVTQPAVETTEEPYSAPNVTNVQSEPLDLGVSRTKELESKVAPPAENRECRKRARAEEKTEKDEEKKVKRSRLLDLLTSKNISAETTNTDPLEQLKDVLANPKYSVPDPLLVPKARLSALVSSPGKEIPRLLARRAQDLSYFSILSDPDVLVVSLSHLQSLIKKPINEEEIQKYQKQTEAIRIRMRQECFNNNYENMASGNWNQCYWLPSFQQALPFEQMPPDVLSMLNCMPPPGSCCQDVALSATSVDLLKQMQYQKEAAIWQELAIQQLSINPSCDQFNNNLPANCDLTKDGVCGGMCNQDVCSNYGCYPSPNTPPMPIKSNTVPSKNSNHKYQSDPMRKVSQPYLPPVPCNGSPMDYLMPSCDDLFSNTDNQFLQTEIDNEKYKIANETKIRDRYDSLRQMLQNSSENADLLQHFETQLHALADDERKIFKESQENRTQSNRNTNTKESKDEPVKSNRPVVPKIKVRKHLIDPNRRPKLLNTDGHVLHAPVFPGADYNTSHLWNPFFCR